MKRTFSLFLALVMVFSLCTTALAANAIKNVDTKNFQANLKKNGEAGLILLNRKAIKLEKLQDLEIEPGDTLKIYLTADLFVDNVGATIASQDKTPEYVSRNQLRAGKVTLRRAQSSGSKAFDSVGLKYDSKGAYINIDFAETYASTKALDFSTTLYLYVNDKRVNATALTVSGVLETDTIAIYSDTDYVDLSDGSVAEAQESVKQVEIDLGNGVTVLTSVSRNARVYGTCSARVSSADAKILAKYPYVQEVLTLSTVNVRKSGKPVHIDVNYRMYVYDATGKYIGTTNQMLPYSAKYYLSDNKYASIKLS